MLKNVTNFFGDPFKKEGTLRFIKRKDLFSRDQHHKEVYSVNFGELFFVKLRSITLEYQDLKD